MFRPRTNRRAERLDAKAVSDRGRGRDHDAARPRACIAPMEGFVLVTEEEIFGGPRAPPSAPRSASSGARSLEDLRALDPAATTSCTSSTASAATSASSSAKLVGGVSVDLPRRRVHRRRQAVPAGLSPQSDPEVLGRRGGRAEARSARRRDLREDQGAGRDGAFGRWPTSSCGSTPSATARRRSARSAERRLPRVRSDLPVRRDARPGGARSRTC